MQFKRFPRALGLVFVAAAILLVAQQSRAEEPSCHDAHSAPEIAEAAATVEATDQVAAGGAHRSGGLELPAVELLDQDGETVEIYEDLIAGRVVAMNFIFTTCTTVCPPMGASFGKLQRELGDLLGSEVSLISVSIDPTTDTPPRLKSWGAKFDAGESWSLLTGAKQDVDQVLRALEAFTPTPEDHGPLVLLGNDRTGTWTRVNGLTPPAKLAAMLEQMVHDNAELGQGELSQAELSQGRAR